MEKAIDSPVVLTVRGTLIPHDAESARTLHNQTAGSPQGIAAARALGDLSHNVYLPLLGNKQSSAEAGELLFLDRWDSAQGLMDFFSNAHVQAQASKLFSSRDAAVWMPARGSFSYALPAPQAKTERIVGMLRAPIGSAEKALEIFTRLDRAGQREARRRGLLSHELFIKLPAPDDKTGLELLGLDLWCDAAGMAEQYGDNSHMAELAQAFTGRPQATIWTQATGGWQEW